MKKSVSAKILHNFVTLLTCVSVTVQPVLAQSVVADGGAHGPTVVQTANGVDMVLIERPNGAGVSHNTFDQFNVPQSGVILNNIQGNYGITNLGGFVQGNGNLSGGTASLIINEVTAPNPSDLNGYLEVAGARADVVVANAYGITCDGCGFINTDHVALTTGTLNYDAVGQLNEISVTEGAITIGEGGADARGVSQFDLIARQVNFAGTVQGQRVLVIAGQNDVIFSTGAVTENAGDGSASPEYAIDSTVFGGMYANKITIVSTEKGVGVRAPNTLSSSTQGMTITADGRLVIGQASSAGSISATSNSGSVVVREKIITQEPLSLAAKRDLILEADGMIVSAAAANISADRNIQVESGAQIVSRQDLSLNANSVLQMADGSAAFSYGDLNITGGNADIADNVTIYAGAADADTTPATANLTFDLTGDATFGGANLFATGALTFDADAININADAALSPARFVSLGDLTVTSRTLNTTGVRLEAAGNAHIETAQRYTAGQDTVAIAGSTLTLSADELILTGALLQSTDDITLTTNDLRGTGSQIAARHDVTINTGTADITADVVAQTGALNVTASSDADFTGTLVGATGITLAGDAHYTLDGVLQSPGAINISGASVRSDADITTNNGVTLTATGDLQSNGAISAITIVLDATRDLAVNGDLTAGAALLNGRNIINSATVATAGDLTVTAANGLRNSGTLDADGQLNVAAATIDNAASGVLEGTTLVAQASETFDNTGQIRSAGVAVLAGTNAFNNRGDVQAQGALGVTTAALTNAGNIDAFGGVLFLQGLERLNNAGGKLSSDVGVQMEFVGSPTLTEANWGTVQSSDWLTLQGADGSNIAELTIAAGLEIAPIGQLIVRTDDLINNGTLASATGNLIVSASNDITNTGVIYAGGDLLALRAGSTILNDGGAILAARDLLVCGVSTDDCTQDLSADRAGQLINRTRDNNGTYVPGVIQTLNGDMILAVNDVINQRIGTAEVTTSDPYNRNVKRVGRNICGTRLFGACILEKNDDYHVLTTYETTTTVDLSGTSSEIRANGNLTFNSQNIHNDFATISVTGNIFFDADKVINQGAQAGTTQHSDRQEWEFINKKGIVAGGTDTPTSGITPSQTFTPTETFTGIIEAGGTISGTIPEALINGSVTEGEDALTAQGTDAPTLDDATQTAALTGLVSFGGLVDDVANPTAAGVDLSGISGNINLSVLGNDQLFITTPDFAGGYVIETRPEFIDQDQFVSSDYFLETINFDPDATQTRLADPFAETYLIRNQITDLVGRSILNPELSEKEQIRLMYDNAVDAASDLGLRPGVALTPSQIAALTTDIVWLEEQVINGESVLVPRVYLGASGGIGDQFNPAIITASTINLDVGSLTNSGAIAAFDNLVINSATDINNLGGSLTAGDILQLQAKQGDLLNLSGLIEGGSVTISAQNIISETDVVRFGDGVNVQEVAAPSALISATSGVLTLNADGDITVIGGDLSGHAGINVLAGGDVDFAALKLNNNYDGEGTNWSFKQETTTSQVGSITSAEGGISITSAQFDEAGNAVGGGNIIFEGTQINARDAVKVKAAAGHVVIGAATDESYTDQSYESDGLIFDSEVRDERYKVTHQTTSITGSEITVYASGTVFNQAADFTTTDGDFTLNSATGNVIAGSLVEIDAHNRYSEASAFGGFIDYSTEKQSLRTTARSTNVDARGDINLIAGGDLEVQGGTYNATGDINTKVAGETRVLATVDTDFSYIQRHENDSLLVVDTTKVNVDQTANFTQFNAGGSVNLDPTSDVTVGVVASQAAVGTAGMNLVGVSDVSDRNEHMAITGLFATGENDNRITALTQDQLGNALNGIQSNSASGGSGEDGGDAFDFSDSKTLVSIPGAADGKGYAYLDDLKERDNVTFQSIELTDHSFKETDVQLGVTGQLVVAYASGQAVGLLNLGGGVMVNAAANAAISGTIEGAVTGNFDPKDILVDAAFSAATAGITDTVKIEFDNPIMNTGLLGEGSQFTLGSVTESAVQNGFTAGLTTAVHGGEFADNFKSGLSSSILTLATADVHTLVGDQYNDANDNPINGGEGSIGHVLTHATVGCVSGELQGGSCDAGAAAGGVAAVLSGQIKGSGADYADAQEWTDEVRLAAGLGAALTGADNTDVQIAAGVGQSTFENNYLTHAQIAEWEDAIIAFRECVQLGGDCQHLIAEQNELYKELQAESAENTQNLYADCGSGEKASCRQHLDHVRGYENWRHGSGLNPFDGNPTSFDVLATDVDVTGSTNPNDLDWGKNLDSLALDIYNDYVEGEITLSAANSQIYNKITAHDGAMNIVVGGGTAVAGAVVIGGACAITAGVGCVIGVIGGGAAIVGSADEAIDGVSTLVLGEAVENPYEVLGEMAGLTEEEANNLRQNIDKGAMFVELASGGLAIIKGGRHLATVTRNNSGDTVLRNVDEVNVPIQGAPNRTPDGPNPGTRPGAVDAEAGGASYYDQYKKADGSGWDWPDNLGFAGKPSEATVPVGTRLDRYGSADGSFMSPAGTPLDQRAMAPGSAAETLHTYEVVKPLPVIQGEVAPAFGQSGGGAQMLPNLSERVNVDWLVNNGYLREMN